MTGVAVPEYSEFGASRDDLKMFVFQVSACSNFLE